MALSAPIVSGARPERAHPFAMNDERPMTNSTVYAGSLVCFNASGHIAVGSTATTLIAAGVATETKTNSGSAGSTNVRFRQGVFKFNNSSAGDAIAIADIGDDCYIVDDETVAKTDGSSSRSRAGKVIDVVSDGVFVLIGLGV